MKYIADPSLFPIYNPELPYMEEDTLNKILPLVKEAYEFFGLAFSHDVEVFRYAFRTREFICLPTLYKARNVKRGDVVLDRTGAVYEVVRSGKKQTVLKQWLKRSYLDGYEGIRPKSFATAHVNGDFFIIEGTKIMDLCNLSDQIFTELCEACGKPPHYVREGLWFGMYFLMLLIKALDLKKSTTT